MNEEVNNQKRSNDLDEFCLGRIFSLRFDVEWSYKEISEKLNISVNTIKSFCQQIHFFSMIMPDLIRL